MNRQQAINYLLSSGFSEEQINTIEQAFKQEPTTKNDSGVDTDKLIADCEKMSFDFELFGRPTKALLLDAVKNIVKDLPSVTPQEPKTGHWMGDSYGYICSNCEHSLNDLAQSMDYISFSKPKYCPNCGAKMVEPQESEG